MRAVQVFRFLTALLLLGLLSACSTTNIMRSNPLYIGDPAQDHATVYFLRPPLVRTRGIADTDLKVELDEIPLLQLSRDEYAMVYIKPSETDVILRNLTFLTGKPNPVEVWRARHMIFEAGKTYYVQAHFQQEEFRGIYYVPKMIDEATAKEEAKRMTPAGPLAKKFPLYVPPPMEIKPTDVLKEETNE